MEVDSFDEEGKHGRRREIGHHELKLHTGTCDKASRCSYIHSYIRLNINFSLVFCTVHVLCSPCSFSIY